MLLVEAVAQWYRKPIGVYTSFNKSQLGVVGIHAVSLAGNVARTRTSLVKQSCTTLYLQLLRSVGKVVVAKVGSLQCTGEAIRHTYLTRLRGHGSYYHNAVGCTRTINGCSGSVLQDSDTFDTCRVEVVDFLNAHLETVHDKCRKVRIVLKIRL